MLKSISLKVKLCTCKIRMANLHLLTDFYYDNILIQRNGMDHIKLILN